MKIFDLTTPSGRAAFTSYFSSLEHKIKALEMELQEAKETALSYMDENGFKALEAGGRTWKAVTREQARLDLKKVEALCHELEKDVAELKTLRTSHYFQLCK